MDDVKNIYTVPVGKSQRKSPRQKYRLDNNKMNLRDTGYEAGNWIQVVQDRVH
jgi:hypothetical protein